MQIAHAINSGLPLYINFKRSGHVSLSSQQPGHSRVAGRLTKIEVSTVQTANSMATGHLVVVPGDKSICNICMCHQLGKQSSLVVTYKVFQSSHQLCAVLQPQPAVPPLLSCRLCC